MTDYALRIPRVYTLNVYSENYESLRVSFYEWFIRKLIDFRMNILSDGYSSKRWVLVFLATVLYS